MFGVTFFGFSFFGNSVKHKNDLEEKVAGLLFRCGILSDDIEVDVFFVNKSQCCVRIAVDHEEPSLWLYGPDLERYVQSRMSLLYGVNVLWVGFVRSVQSVLYEREPLRGSARINDVLSKRSKKYIKELEVTAMLRGVK